MIETRNFKHRELSCSCCGGNQMNVAFMEKLQLIRDEFQQPMIITSAYRCPQYNSQISSTGSTGPHTTGRAVDIQIFGQEAYELMKLCLKYGMTGLGFKMKGPRTNRFLHCDDLTNTSISPRPWIWSY